MASRIARLKNKKEFQRAGNGEPIEMLPVPGNTPMVPPKWLLEALAHGIAGGEFISCHGPTGSGKTATLEALWQVPENWEALCKGLGIPCKPLKMLPFEMMNAETPGEMYCRRAIRDGCTYDEDSGLVCALREADACRETHQPVIWAREMGRVHSASVQHGLLDLMTQGPILLPGGDTILGKGIAWVADSNYNCDETAVYTTVTLDDGVAARFTVNLPFDYPFDDDTLRILYHLMDEGYLPPVPGDVVVQMVSLGEAIREEREQGNLSSVTPPTMRAYFAFLRMYSALPHLGARGVADVTLLGAASPADRANLAGVCSTVFTLVDKESEEQQKSELKEVGP